MKMQKFRATSSGFTLAEVMIAMGIVASVMVALLGMIPLGVRSVREATNMTISGRIAQEVISNVQQANWVDVLREYDQKTFRFDGEGFLLREGGREKVASFTARVIIPREPISIGETKYDVNTLKKILVEVEYTPEGRSIRVRPGQVDNPNITNYNFYVANQNKSI